MSDRGVLRVDLSTSEVARRDPGTLVVGTITIPDDATVRRVAFDGTTVTYNDVRELVVVAPAEFAHWERFEGDE